MEARADTLIYYALTMSAKKGSYAKLQILAACHKDAVPCVMINEGKKLFQMFQGLFTMTNLHQASLPTVRVEFYAITQREKESILAYTSRVDIIVATLAKLGEKVSTGAWIHALGNGLRSEFKECKDGVLYSKPGYDNVLSVKTKLISEEAVLHSKSKSAKDQPTHGNGKDDEIALKLQDVKISKDAKERANIKAPDASTDTAFLLKGKGAKEPPKGRDTLKASTKVLLQIKPGITNGINLIKVRTTIRTTGNDNPKAKAEANGQVVMTEEQGSIPRHSGVTSISPLVTVRIGASTTLTGREGRPYGNGVTITSVRPFY
jgi:hypothetical protein